MATRGRMHQWSQDGGEEWDAQGFVPSPNIYGHAGNSHSSQNFMFDMMQEDGPGAGLREPLEQLMRRIGPIPLSMASMVSLAVELFALSEGIQSSRTVIQDIWGHSLRTGYLAALIAEAQGVGAPVIWQSFAGGMLHDIGLLMLLSQEFPPFLRVVEQARVRSVDLQVLEQECYGTTHAELGAALLARWGGCQALVNTVKFHDDPIRNADTQFCPAAGVFLANILDGGGIAQDGDGVVNSERSGYLRGLGLWDQLPYWQGRMRDLQSLSFG